MSGWIGVDLDGTLAHYTGHHHDEIGAPVGPMVDRVKAWLAEGVEVRIFTARVADPQFYAGVHAKVEAWCLQHIGQILPVTCSKDYGMIELWDDRCVQVVPNTGKPVLESVVLGLAHSKP